ETCSRSFPIPPRVSPGRYILGAIVDDLEGSLTLRVTVFSGDPTAPGASEALPDRTLPPGGFHQYDGILDMAGFDNGYVRVERIEGTAPFYAYGVVNDGGFPGQGSGDGAYVPARE
ncbi:MAG: hypothetical protein OXI92_18335, partial [Acidobacteriota bacterium]|nr:hypothetical protein [Acidobacteriota bacterium]